MKRRFISQFLSFQYILSCFFFWMRNAIFFKRPIIVNIADIHFVLSCKGGVVRDIWSGLRFEHKEMSFILNILKPSMTFMDVGSNVGLFAISAAKKISNGRVYAFEPCTWTFQILQQNIHLNDLNNIVPIRIALGDYTGKAVLQVNAPGKDGLNTIGKPTHSDCQIVRQEAVPVMPLDVFMEENNIPRVDVMKVDVEGSELSVFHGGRRLLQRSDAPVILCETYSWCTAGFGYHPVEIMWFLEDCGYSIFVLDGKNGKAIPRKPSHVYDAMIVAIKPEHPSFYQIQGNIK